MKTNDLPQIIVCHVSRMLGVSEEEIPELLLERLGRIESLANEAGGYIYSRQILAVIVDDWNRELRKQAAAASPQHEGRLGEA